MPEKETLERAEQDKREGKSPSTQAGEFVREEMRHIREGQHGARSTKQAIAIGLSKARRAGVKLKPPQKGKASARTRRSAELALKRARSRKKPSRTRSRAIHAALRREGHSAASRSSLARQPSCPRHPRTGSSAFATAKACDGLRSLQKWDKTLELQRHATDGHRCSAPADGPHDPS